MDERVVKIDEPEQISKMREMMSTAELNEIGERG
jgi:hypothetical protein